MTPLESVLVAEAMGYDPSLFATFTVHEALGLKVCFLAFICAMGELNSNNFGAGTVNKPQSLEVQF